MRNQQQQQQQSHIRMHRAKPARSREYQTLRHVVPSIRCQRDVDKIEVVTEAARYIDHLHKTLIERFVLCGIPDSLKDILGTDNANELGSQHIMNLVANMATQTQRTQKTDQQQRRQEHSGQTPRQKQKRKQRHQTTTRRTKGHTTSSRHDQLALIVPNSARLWLKNSEAKRTKLGKTSLAHLRPAQDSSASAVTITCAHHQHQHERPPPSQHPPKQDDQSKTT